MRALATAYAFARCRKRVASSSALCFGGGAFADPGALCGRTSILTFYAAIFVGADSSTPTGTILVTQEVTQRQTTAFSPHDGIEVTDSLLKLPLLYMNDYEKKGSTIHSQVFV
jgi:hypothetical protein